MRRCNQVVGVLLLIFSIWIITVSKDLVYTVEFSPGAGFFPIWLGISMLICSLILLLKSTIFKYDIAEENPLPGKQALLRIVFILGSLLVSILIFERIGFIITMFFFVAFLLVFLEKYRWYTGAMISVFMVSAIYGIFKVWLNVNLPLGLFH
jgi:putative tricarboxylic transport membrane protein